MASADTIIGYARQQLGKPYIFGDEGPNSFDCSGLMQYAYGLAGVKLPRTSQQQQRAVTRVSDPKPGDLVFWGDPAYHVALYLGNGRMISAPHSGAVVHESAVYGNPTYGRVSGVSSIPGGAAARDIWQQVADKTGQGATAVDDFFGAIRGTAYQVTFAVLGLALVGGGMVMLTSGAARKRAASMVSEVVE